MRIWPLIKALMGDVTGRRFAFAVSLGMGFSTAVILSTLGVMDGFALSLKSALRKASGDLQITSTKRYFEKKEIESYFKKSIFKDYVFVLQTEAFIIGEELSRGVQLRSPDANFFHPLLNTSLNLSKGAIAIGSEVAKQLKLNVGSEVALAFSSGGGQGLDLPRLIRVKVGQIIHHGLYQKDLRLVYSRIDDLREWLGAGANEFNWATVNLKDENSIEDVKNQLQMELGPDFVANTFWHEFSTLLEAAKVEKMIIVLILQLIVAIACFNVVAFATYLSEKKSRELFLFKALGLSSSKLIHLWYSLTGILWLGACFFSIGMVQVFDWCLQHLMFLKLPGEIYNIERLSIQLSWTDYGIVFLALGVWSFLIATPGLRRLSKGPIILGLRKEFS